MGGQQPGGNEGLPAHLLLLGAAPAPGSAVGNLQSLVRAGALCPAAGCRPPPAPLLHPSGSTAAAGLPSTTQRGTGLNHFCVEILMICLAQVLFLFSCMDLSILDTLGPCLSLD